MAFGAKVAAVEFARDEVRVAVVRTGGKRPELVGTHAAPVVCEDPELRPEASARALDAALDGLRHRPAVYTLCLDAARATVRNLTIPFRGAGRVAKAVPFELEPHLPFPLEELAVDFNTVAEVNGQTEVLAVGMRRRHLDEHLAVLDTVGVESEAVSLDAAGLTALWCAARRPSKGLEAVLHLRESGACLAIVKGRALAFLRHIPIGGPEFLEQPARMAREVQNTLRSFTAQWRGGGEIGALDVTGAVLPQDFLDAFSAALNLPVTSRVMLNDLRGGAALLKREGDAARFNRWEAAIGVAWTASGGDFSLDLLRSERTFEGAAGGMVAHLLFSSCLALALVLGWAFYYHQSRARSMAEAGAVREKTAEIQAEIDALTAEGLGEDVDVTAFGDPPLLDLMREITARMPDTLVTVTEIKVAPPGTRGAWLTIAGETPSAAQFNAMFEDLKKSELFKVADDTSIRLQGDRTTFRIRAFRPQEEIKDETQS